MTAKYLTKKEVMTLTRLSTNWVRELVKRNHFPQPIRMSPSPQGRLLWNEEEVSDWMESRRESAT